MITLVTGATGLVGNNVVRQLLALGGTVRVLTRSTADRRPLAGLDGVELFEGDVRDAEAVRRAACGVQQIVHAAAYVHIGWRGLELARAINVEGTRNVVAAAAREHATLVHVSSIDALHSGTPERPGDEDSLAPGEVPCPYVLTKREAEQVVLDEVQRGLRAMIVNPGFMIGPNDWKPSSGRMLLSVARGWGLWAPLGVNCYCDVRDVAAGIVSALERGQPGRRYILGGESLSYFQAWRIFADVTGGTPPMFPIGPLIRMCAGPVGDLIARFSGCEPDVNSASVAISAQKRYFTSARAQRELGYRIRALRDSASDAWSWFRQQGYA